MKKFKRSTWAVLISLTVLSAVMSLIGVPTLAACIVQAALSIAWLTMYE